MEGSSVGGVEWLSPGPILVGTEGYVLGCIIIFTFRNSMTRGVKKLRLHMWITNQKVLKNSDHLYLHASVSEKVKISHFLKITENSHVIHQNKDLGEKITNSHIKTM